MYRLILIIIFSSCASTNSSQLNYIWQREQVSEYNYIEKLENKLASIGVEYLKKNIIRDSKFAYAASHAFGFYNGEKFLINKVFTKRDLKNNLLGFDRLFYPLTLKDYRAKTKIDPFDYHIRIYVQGKSKRTMKDLAINMGVKIFCNESDKKVRCRDKNHSPFFDYEIKVPAREGILFNNIKKSIIGMYFEWKPHITNYEFVVTNKNLKIQFDDFLSKYKDDSITYNAIKHRLIFPGMSVDAAVLSIGNGDDLGISYQSNDHFIKKVFYNQNNRSKGILE